MRILQLTDFYPPTIGGLERHVQSLSQQLTIRGHSVSVAALSQRNLPRFSMDGGVPVHRLDGWSRYLPSEAKAQGHQFHPTVPDPQLARALARLTATFKPDVVHAHSWSLFSYLPIARARKAKVVMTLHDYGAACAKKSFVNRGRVCTGPGMSKCVRCAAEQYGTTKALLLLAGLRTSRHLYRHVDAWIAISHAVARASEAALNAPIEIIPTFVPDEALVFAQGARPPQVPTDGDYLLFVGALGRHKGIYTLLDAYKRLSDPPPLVLLGTGRRDSPVSLPDGVSMFKDVAHNDVMAATRHATAAIVPSLWPEPFGQTAVEAMLCGTALIASTAGGLSEIVEDGVTGVSFPAGDVERLHACMERVLADGALRVRLGNAAAREGRRYLVSEVVEQIENTYASQSGEGGPQRAVRAP